MRHAEHYSCNVLVLSPNLNECTLSTGCWCGRRGFSIYPPLFAHQCWMYCTAFPSELRVFIVVAFSICLWFQSIIISILYIDLHKLNYMIIYYIIYTYILSTVVCTNLAHRFKFYMSGLPPAVRVAADDPLSTELL